MTFADPDSEQAAYLIMKPARATLTDGNPPSVRPHHAVRLMYRTEIFPIDFR
jgi:hypothetical protein